MSNWKEKSENRETAKRIVISLTTGGFYNIETAINNFFFDIDPIVTTAIKERDEELVKMVEGMKVPKPESTINTHPVIERSATMRFYEIHNAALDDIKRKIEEN